MTGVPGGWSDHLCREKPEYLECVVACQPQGVDCIADFLAEGCEGVLDCVIQCDRSDTAGRMFVFMVVSITGSLWAPL